MTEGPGPGRLTRGGWLLLALVLAVVVVWLLFEFIFPWVESRWYNPTVGMVDWWLPRT